MIVSNIMKVCLGTIILITTPLYVFAGITIPSYARNEILLDDTQVYKDVQVTNNSTEHFLTFNCPSNAHCKPIIMIQEMFCLESSNSNTTMDPTYLVFTFDHDYGSQTKKRICKNITVHDKEPYYVDSDLEMNYTELLIQPVGTTWGINTGNSEASAKIAIHYVVMKRFPIDSELQHLDLYLDSHRQYEVSLDENLPETSNYETSLLVNLNKMKCIGTEDYLQLNVNYIDGSNETIKWCELDTTAKSKSLYKVKSVQLKPFGQNWSADNGIHSVVSISRHLAPKKSSVQKCPEGYFNCQQSYSEDESIVCIPEEWTCNKVPNCGTRYVHADESSAICEKDSGNDDYYYQYFYLHEIERLRTFVTDLLLYHSGLTVLVMFIILIAFMLKLIDMHSKLEIQLRRLGNNRRDLSQIGLTNYMVPPPNYFIANGIAGASKTSPQP